MDFHEQVGHDVRRASARMSFIAPETDLAVVADWEAVQTTSTPTRELTRFSQKDLLWNHEAGWSGNVKVRHEKRTGCARWLIDPRTAKWLPYWDGLKFLVLVAVAIYTPYEVAFFPIGQSTVTFDDLATFVFNRAVDVIFAVDIALNFFLIYEAPRSSIKAFATDAAAKERYSSDLMMASDPELLQRRRRDMNKEVVTDPKRIAKHYLQTWFAIDVLSTRPWLFSSTCTFIL